MAPPSPVENQPTPRETVEGQLRECYGRVVYTHKTQEKCADILLVRLRRIKLLQIILSAVAATGFLGVILEAWPTLAAIVGVVVSTVLLGLNTYTKDYDLGELAQKHRQAAADLWLLRERYLAAITDLRTGKVSLEKILARRDEILDELHNVYSGAPSTNVKAYLSAQKALQKSEEMSFNDTEIDSLLPSELRRVAVAGGGVPELKPAGPESESPSSPSAPDDAERLEVPAHGNAP